MSVFLLSVLLLCLFFKKILLSLLLLLVVVIIVRIIQQFTFGVFREGFFAEIFLIHVSLGFSVQGVVSSGVMLLGCKPIAKFLAGRSPSTDPPCQKDQEPFSLAVPGGVCVCGLLRTSGSAFAVRVFAEKNSAHFGEFLQNFRIIAATFTGAVETIFGNFPQKFPQHFRNFSKCSLQCVGVVIVRS